MKKLINTESPELEGLLYEFRETLEVILTKLQPILDECNKNKQKLRNLKHGMTYMEMKYNLLLSYSIYLSFYFLLKCNGYEGIQNHPVILKLTHIKTLLERLKPLDQKLVYQINKAIQLGMGGGMNEDKNQMSYKPKLKKKFVERDDEDLEDEDEIDDEELDYGEEGEDEELDALNEEGEEEDDENDYGNLNEDEESEIEEDMDIDDMDSEDRGKL